MSQGMLVKTAVLMAINYTRHRAVSTKEGHDSSPQMQAKQQLLPNTECSRLQTRWKRKHFGVS